MIRWRKWYLSVCLLIVSLKQCAEELMDPDGYGDTVYTEGGNFWHECRRLILNFRALENVKCDSIFLWIKSHKMQELIRTYELLGYNVTYIVYQQTKEN